MFGTPHLMKLAPALYSLFSIATAGTVLFDQRIPKTSVSTDFDNSTSAVARLFKQLITPANALPSSVLSLAASHERTCNEQAIGISINNGSIFVPGGGKPQLGFRRTDLNSAVNLTTATTGITTFHQSFRASNDLPLNLSHGYLLASMEISTGDHIWDIFVGSDFSSDPSTPLPTPNASMIRVRDLSVNTLYETPFVANTLFNFAVEVNWNNSTLAVFASTGDDDLVPVTQARPNNKKVKQFPGQGDWHLQLIKFPIADPADNETQRSDVVNFGIQEGTTEQVFVSRSFLEETADGVTLSMKSC